MKKILPFVLAILTISFISLLFPREVKAGCYPSELPTAPPGCPLGYTCRYDIDIYTDNPALKDLAGQVCSDPTSMFCFCYPNVGTAPPPVSPLPPLPPGPYPSGPSAAMNSRPYQCSVLGPPASEISSCATTPTMGSKVSYYWNEAGKECGGKEYISKSWNASFTADPTKVYIPFVGKKGQESEQKFLADYFEGTAYYYNKVPIDVNSTDYLSKLGVFRKLAPEDIQDDLKRKMVQRALGTLAGKAGEEAIHDYEVSYGGYKAKLSEFTSHLKPRQEAELYAWQKSDGGKWYRLWTAIPMFSREDKEGELSLTPQSPIDSFEITTPPDNQKFQVPHLARLYEVTKELQKLLLPFTKATEGKNVLGEKTYLAEAGEPTGQPTLSLNLRVPSGSQPGTYQIDAIGYVSVPSGCGDFCDVGQFNVSYTFNGNVVGGCSLVHPRFGRSTCANWSRWRVNDMGGCAAPSIQMSFGDTYGITINMTSYQGIVGQCGRTVGASCWMKLTETGWQTNCGAPPPPGPICGMQKSPVDLCQKKAITGEGDSLCCKTVSATLRATDTFVPDKTRPAGCINGDELVCFKDYGVERKVQVFLTLPLLGDIWQQTTDVTNGIFNIFRSQRQSPFEDLDAASPISYLGASADNPQFYFPHLGGIQKAKEWVLELLSPLKFPGVFGPPEKPLPPAGPVYLTYTLPFRDPTITISSETKAKIIKMVQTIWPQTLMNEQTWDFVVSEAKKNGWNPAFVLALWIEETGASHTVQTGESNDALGCAPQVKSDLAGSLNCLFSNFANYTGFKEFMLAFSGDTQYGYFKTNPNFPRGIKNIYDLIIPPGSP